MPKESSLNREDLIKGEILEHQGEGKKKTREIVKTWANTFYFS